MQLVERLSRLFILIGLGYLGFYVYGLVMGVFSPAEMAGFTALAVVFAAAFAFHVVRVREAMRDPEQHERIMHELHAQRERRGF